MALIKKLEKYLNDKKIKYEVLTHKVVYNAIDKARTLRIDPKSVVKSCFIKITPKSYAIAMVSADKIVDLKKLKNTINNWFKKQGIKPIRKIDFANEKWMRKNLLGKVGANPPFGELYKLPMFIDNSLLKRKKLIMSAGEYKKSLMISIKEFNKIFSKCANVIKAAISEKPKKKIKFFKA